jgi:hypothetical protein
MVTRKRWQNILKLDRDYPWDRFQLAGFKVHPHAGDKGLVLIYGKQFNGKSLSSQVTTALMNQYKGDWSHTGNSDVDEGYRLDRTTKDGNIDIHLSETTPESYVYVTILDKDNISSEFKEELKELLLVFE